MKAIAITFFMIGFIVGSFCFSIIFLCTTDNLVVAKGIRIGYKQGQIDCANGIMKYELEQLSDGSVMWQKKDEEDIKTETQKCRPTNLRLEK